MKNPIDFSAYPHIRPICLPANDDSYYDNFVSTVTGWGTTAFRGSLSTTLREVNVRVITNSECKNNYTYPSSWITEQMMCAIVDGGGKDSCQGDSGNNYE
jgi:secreted trypsin-like serine protease